MSKSGGGGGGEGGALPPPPLLLHHCTVTMWVLQHRFGVARLCPGPTDLPLGFGALFIATSSRLSAVGFGHRFTVLPGSPLGGRRHDIHTHTHTIASSREKKKLEKRSQGTRLTHTLDQPLGGTVVLFEFSCFSTASVLQVFVFCLHAA